MKGFKAVFSLLLGIALLVVVLIFAVRDDTNGSTYPAKGLDLSSWQSEVDFSKLKQQGISFVILRAGTSKGKDAKFEKFYREAKSAGLDIGCYFYTYSTDTTSAQKDAQTLLKWIKHKKFALPIYYDVEDDSLLSLTAEQRMNICERFRKTLQEKDYLVGIYTNEYWLNHYLDTKTVKKEYELWLATWTTSGENDLDMSSSCRVWQYSQSGEIEGINGNVDLDICYFDYPSFILRKGLNNFHKNQDA